MKDILPLYGLDYGKFVNENDLDNLLQKSEKVVNKKDLNDFLKRGIKCLLTFDLNGRQWDNFSNYFKDISIK